MSDFRNRVLIASGFHAPVADEIDVLTDCLIAIDAEGMILSVQRPGDDGYALAKAEADRQGRLSRLPAGCLLLPGLVDCHVHAPQYPQLGTALDVPLETWLHAHTFPLEARYADLVYAKRVYGLLVDDLLANGTTTALYFATIHQDATRILVDTCLEKGQRALIGKVAMDNAEQCPDYYRDASPDAALQGTQALIDYVSTHPDNTASRVWPVVTPRFIPACTDATLEGLGAMARDCGCHVQTHCSESDWEHAYVLSRHGVTDAMSLDRFGLLTRRSMLAHANLLTADDMDLIKLRQAAVAHCPLSNAYFAGAVFPLRAALEKGLHVGLGSDISGGPSASVLDNMRAAILVSRMLETGVDPGLPPEKRASGTKARIDFRHAFHVATAGGGKALDLPIGQFAPGYRFDAIVVDPQAAQSTLRIYESDEMTETLLQKIVFTASRANISAVFIDGCKVA
ncbi:guanine deaminase [Agrobacterium vitis]